MNKITPIEYEAIIVREVNKVYQNFKKNCETDFEVPQSVAEFFKGNEEIKKRDQFEGFCESLKGRFHEWKVKAEEADKSIILNHLIAYLQNSLIALMSLDTNLQSENLSPKVILTSTGVDIIVATAVQMVGQKTTELLETYNKLEMEKDPLIVFESLNKLLKSINELSADQAFIKLMDHLLEYIRTFQACYSKLSQLEIDDFSESRIEMFMSFLDTYYLFIIMLRLVLTYPMQEGLLEKNTFESIIPKVELY